MLVLVLVLGIEVARGVVDSVEDVTALGTGGGCVGKGPSSTTGAVTTEAPGPPAAD